MGRVFVVLGAMNISPRVILTLDLIKIYIAVIWEKNQHGLITER